jgi:hypothetical protein
MVDLRPLENRLWRLGKYVRGVHGYIHSPNLTQGARFHVTIQKQEVTGGIAQMTKAHSANGVIVVVDRVHVINVLGLQNRRRDIVVAGPIVAIDSKRYRSRVLSRTVPG